MAFEAAVLPPESAMVKDLPERPTVNTYGAVQCPVFRYAIHTR
jgi:hypothetical protein